jgi:DNA polymerase III subunit epsilon
MLSFLRRHPRSAAAEAYHQATRPRVDHRQPVDEVTFVVLDAETTGLKVGHDRLLAVALVEAQGGRVRLERSASWLVRQPDAAVNAAVAVHGILPHDTAAGVPEADMLEQLLARLTAVVLVGHHIGFDAAMLDESLRHHHHVRLRNPTIDTARMAMTGIDAFRRTGYANQRPPTLEELCAHTGLPVVARHTAEGDAFTTAQLFLLLCARLRRRLGRPLRLGDLPVGRP